MEKYIVPIQPITNRWLGLFDEFHRTEEYQLGMMNELVSMSNMLTGLKIKNEARLGLNEAIHSYMEELADAGIINFGDWNAATHIATKFCGQLISYLTSAGVFGKDPMLVKFVGFFGANIIVKVSDNIEDEFDEMDERAWREH